MSQGGTGEITTPGALRFVRGSQAYAAGYDPNGNMTYRCKQDSGLIFTWDEENHLTRLDSSAGNVAIYGYDGDGNRVKETHGGATTVYIGDYYEYTSGIGKKYFYFWGRRIAMNDGYGVRYWLLGDHLGSSSVAYNINTGADVKQRYAVWGAIRGGVNMLPTDYTFTGQKLDTTTGLLYYGARWYDPGLARWTQPDTIVPNPGDPQTLNRYMCWT